MDVIFLGVPPTHHQGPSLASLLWVPTVFLNLPFFATKARGVRRERVDHSTGIVDFSLSTPSYFPVSAFFDFNVFKPFCRYEVISWALGRRCGEMAYYTIASVCSYSPSPFLNILLKCNLHTRSVHTQEYSFHKSNMPVYPATRCSKITSQHHRTPCAPSCQHPTGNYVQHWVSLVPAHSTNETPWYVYLRICLCRHACEIQLIHGI